MPNSRPYDFDRVVRILFTTVCVCAALCLINYLESVLLPFLVGCLLAFMLEPVVQFNRKLLHLKGRLVASLLTIVEVTIVIVAAIMLIGPYIYAEATQMIKVLRAYADSRMQLPYLPVEVQHFIREYIDINYLSGLITHDQWLDIIRETANRTWEFLGVTASLVLTLMSWMVVLLYMMFIMMDYDKLCNGFKKGIPGNYRSGVLVVVNDVIRSMKLYFRGQTLIAFLVGVMFSIGFTIVGLPLAVVFGLFIGLLNMVPYLQLLSIPLCGLLCLFGAVGTDASFWSLAGGCTLVYCIVQAIQDMVLTPKIMGSIMGLNPAIILLSLSIWGALLGFIGLIIALPLTALIISYYRQYILKDTTVKKAEDDSTAAPAE
mgnify:FL=1